MTEFFFPDNTVLCNFACVNRLDLLKSVTGGRGRWTEAVAYEASQSAKFHPALANMAQEGWLDEPVEITKDSDQRQIERIRRAVFGGTDAKPLQHLGEAQTCYIIKNWAEFSGSWWITDDREALHGAAIALEKPLQTLIEKNMDTLFGVRFVSSEHSTGKKQPGRIDSLGLDENGSPVIFEYKRAVNENVINQGLFYLDWLLDHRGEFKLLVMDKYGTKAAEQIDWSSPRLVCVASDFTRYDEHAIAQINRSIELVRYRDYNGEFLTLDLMASTSAAATSATGQENPSPSSGREKSVAQLYKQSPEDLRTLCDTVDAFLLSLGDDVTKTERKNYFAYRRIKNFACVEIHPQTKKLLVYLKINPASIPLEAGFTRDMSKIGHFGTGDLEVAIGNSSDFTRAQSLILESYAAS